MRPPWKTWPYVINLISYKEIRRSLAHESGQVPLGYSHQNLERLARTAESRQIRNSYQSAQPSLLDWM